MFLQGNQTITLAPASGQTLTVAGVIADQTGSGGTGGNAGAGGIIASGAGHIVFGAVDTYTGTTSLGGGTTLELGSAASATASTLAFTGAGTLQIDALTSKVKTVTGFTGAADALDFAGTAPSNVTLTQTAANTATIDGMVVTGTFGTLSKGGDGGGGTVITAACFGQGTRIATERGEIAIEDLRIGDRAVTGSGATRPIVWIGYRSVSIANHPRPQDVMPVRVQAHAFAPGCPSRDLFLSPDHAVHASGVLIPIRYLLNGASIAQRAASRATWWHVELDAHDAILAEGLPSESYLDTGNRGAFANGSVVVQAHPDVSRAVWDSRAFAPLATGGAEVSAVRTRLLDRLATLGYATTHDPDLRAFAAGQQLPAHVDAEWRCFVVPDDADTLHLRSRTARPAELHPECDDWSEIGCAITAVRVNGRNVALDDPCLTDGWRAPDIALRWTCGDASLAVAPRDIVELRLWRGLRYHLAAPDLAASSHVASEPEAFARAN